MHLFHEGKIKGHGNSKIERKMPALINTQFLIADNKYRAFKSSKLPPALDTE